MEHSMQEKKQWKNRQIWDSQDKGRPLPKFGEWDVNNPASAEGFTVIFSKARDEKKSNEAPGNTAAKDNTSRQEENYQYSPMFLLNVTDIAVRNLTI
ncbi:RPM1-interacting protein 4-like [Cucumis melo var. makuwa]|uniref:RPM1-interacting protein 4-like n=1 Tax=Cucumis melo var. makuwa TaxID=1194695 RepID=A0A5D3E371_CUCMM|nr:RPM1-interacting protein 4-like [Cucumis melo var. makuwa]TYK30238.1 RPM1-interacting protein 4-like [Cucumis melo var. makuwa]